MANTAAAAATQQDLTVPSHIPPEMVLDFDLFGQDPLFEEDLYKGLEGLAAEQRDIFYTPRNGGAWIVCGHKATFDAARDTELFSNSPLHRYDIPQEMIQIPISIDAPAHTAYRQVLMKAFAPKVVGGLEPAIRALTHELIDEILAKGSCDFVKDVSEPLPVLIFMRLMGFPESYLPQFRSWILKAISEPDPAQRQLVWDEVLKITAVLLEERQAEPQDDLMSRLIAAEIDGRPPTFAELQSYCLMLFNAGLDTVVNGMSLAFHHLAMDQDLQARLRADPSGINDAIEEILRRYTFTSPPRFITRDADFMGAPLRKGDFVILLLPAANLDPRAFQAPTEVRPEREETHIAFNSGPHRCVGSHLARLELRVLYEVWLERVPQFRLGDTPWTYHTGFVFSVDSLPLRWD